MQKNHKLFYLCLRTLQTKILGQGARHKNEEFLVSDFGAFGLHACFARFEYRSGQILGVSFENQMVSARAFDAIRR